MAKSIELNQVQDPLFKDRTISDIHMDDNENITVEFLDEEGSDLSPLEDLSREQLRALVLSLLQTWE